MYERLIKITEKDKEDVFYRQKHWLMMNLRKCLVEDFLKSFTTRALKLLDF